MAVPEERGVGEKAAEKEAKEKEVKAPAGIAVGDLEVLVGTSIAGGSVSIKSNGGGAWTLMEGLPVDIASGEKLYVWTRIRAEGDGNPKVAGGSDHVCACRFAVKAGTFDPTTPIESIKTGTEAASDTSFAFKPENETLGSQRLCYVICSSGVDSNTGQAGVNTANASLANITLVCEYNTAEGGGGGFWIARGSRATAGSVGEWTQTMEGATPKGYVSFAVRPKPVAPAVGQVTETDLSQALTHPKRKEIAQVSGTQTAQALTPKKSVTIGQVTGTSAARAIVPMLASAWTTAAHAISDLAIHWRLGVGGNIDLSGNGRDGTKAGAAELGGVAGIVRGGGGDKATNFDGASAIDLNGYTALGGAGEERTIVIFGEGMPAAGSGLIGGTEYTGFSSVFEFEGRDLNLHIGDPVTKTWANAIPAAGRWMLFITKTKEGEWEVFVNNISKGTYGLNNPIVAGTQLGHGFWGWGYNGPLDEFLVYEHVLTEAERKSLAAAAFPSQSIAVGQVLEADTAQSLARVKAQVIARTSETDLAQLMNRGRSVALERAAETDTSRALTETRARGLGQVAEVDLARALTFSKALALERAAESDAARALGASKATAIVQANETLAARALLTAKSLAIAQAAELDVSRTLVASLAHNVAGVVELDTAGTLKVTRPAPKLIPPLQALCLSGAETDALCLSPARAGALSLAAGVTGALLV